MRRTVRASVMAAAITSLLVGCTWVKIPEEAEAVTIVGESQVADCKQLGNVTTEVKWTILGIARNAEKVRSELDDLARKQALGLGADTLVRHSAEEGAGRYSAYRCELAPSVS